MAEKLGMEEIEMCLEAVRSRIRQIESDIEEKLARRAELIEEAWRATQWEQEEKWRAVDLIEEEVNRLWEEIFWNDQEEKYLEDLRQDLLDEEQALEENAWRRETKDEDEYEYE